MSQEASSTVSAAGLDPAPDSTTAAVPNVKSASPPPSEVVPPARAQLSAPPQADDGADHQSDVTAPQVTEVDASPLEGSSETKDTDGQKEEEVKEELKKDAGFAPLEGENAEAANQKDAEAPPATDTLPSQPGQALPDAMPATDLEAPSSRNEDSALPVTGVTEAGVEQVASEAAPMDGIQNESAQREPVMEQALLQQTDVSSGVDTAAVVELSQDDGAAQAASLAEGEQVGVQDAAVAAASPAAAPAQADALMEDLPIEVAEDAHADRGSTSHLNVPMAAPESAPSGGMEGSEHVKQKEPIVSPLEESFPAVSATQDAETKAEISDPPAPSEPQAPAAERVGPESLRPGPESTAEQRPEGGDAPAQTQQGIAAGGLPDDVLALLGSIPPSAVSAEAEALLNASRSESAKALGSGAGGGTGSGSQKEVTPIGELSVGATTVEEATSAERRETSAGPGKDQPALAPVSAAATDSEMQAAPITTQTGAESGSSGPFTTTTTEPSVEEAPDGKAIPGPTESSAPGETVAESSGLALASAPGEGTSAPATTSTLPADVSQAQTAASVSAPSLGSSISQNPLGVSEPLVADVASAEAPSFEIAKETATATAGVAGSEPAPLPVPETSTSTQAAAEESKDAPAAGLVSSGAPTTETASTSTSNALAPPGQLCESAEKASLGSRPPSQTPAIPSASTASAAATSEAPPATIPAGSEAAAAAAAPALAVPPLNMTAAPITPPVTIQPSSSAAPIASTSHSASLPGSNVRASTSATLDAPTISTAAPPAPASASIESALPTLGAAASARTSSPMSASTPSAAASATQDLAQRRVALVLRINKELIRLCVSLQTRNLTADPEYRQVAIRLQSNLGFLAGMADRSGKTEEPRPAPTLPNIQPFQVSTHIADSPLPGLYDQLGALFREGSPTRLSNTAEGKKRAREDSSENAASRKEDGPRKRASIDPQAQNGASNGTSQAPVPAALEIDPLNASIGREERPPSAGLQASQSQPAPPIQAVGQNDGMLPQPSTSSEMQGAVPGRTQTPGAPGSNQPSGPSAAQASALIQAFGPNSLANLHALQTHSKTPHPFVAYMESNVPGFTNLPLQMQMQQMTAMQNAAIQRQRQVQQGQQGPNRPASAASPTAAASPSSRAPSWPQQMFQQQQQGGTPGSNDAMMSASPRLNQAQIQSYANGPASHQSSGSNASSPMMGTGQAQGLPLGPGSRPVTPAQGGMQFGQRSGSAGPGGPMAARSRQASASAFVDPALAAAMGSPHSMASMHSPANYATGTPSPSSQSYGQQPGFPNSGMGSTTPQQFMQQQYANMQAQAQAQQRANMPQQLQQQLQQQFHQQGSPNHQSMHGGTVGAGMMNMGPPGFGGPQGGMQ